MVRLGQGLNYSQSKMRRLGGAEGLPGINLVSCWCYRRTHRCGDHPHKISSTVTSAKYGTPRLNILGLANYYLLNRMCLKVQCLYCVVLKLRIVHPCLDSSLAWVGGWRGGGRTLFWATATCPGLLPPLNQADATLHRLLYSRRPGDSLGMAMEQDYSWTGCPTDLGQWDMGWGTKPD